MTANRSCWRSAGVPTTQTNCPPSPWTLFTTATCDYLNIFFVFLKLNKKFLPRIASVKEKITSAVTEEGNQWLGCGMTYTLFECLKERLEELTEDQPLEVAKEEDDDDLQRGESRGDSKSNAPKKEQLTKAQKRRQRERTDHEGNRPRGWDWVDLIKHLSQGGNKDEAGKPPSSC